LIPAIAFLLERFAYFFFAAFFAGFFAAFLAAFLVAFNIDRFSLTSELRSQAIAL
jgi:hypothetical protein